MRAEPVFSNLILVDWSLDNILVCVTIAFFPGAPVDPAHVLSHISQFYFVNVRLFALLKNFKVRV